MKRSILLLFFVIYACPLFSQSLKDSEEVRKLTDYVMKDFMIGKYSTALDRLKYISNLKDSDFEIIQSQIKAQLPAIDSNYGMALGYEFIVQDEIGDTIMRVV